MRFKKQYFFKALIIFIILALIFIIIWAGSYISYQNGINKLQNNSQQQLDQFVSHLDARLARFKFIPQLIAKNQLLVDLLQQPQSHPRIDLVNHFLEDINNIIGASDTYLMDSSGLTLASSNWQSDNPFNGKSFSFRPYFIEAMKGNLGRYFALGFTSGERGYYFAYPVVYAAQSLGVIVVKMDLSNIELHWSKRKIQFIVSDPDGITFITTRPEWLYQSIKALSSEDHQQIKLSQRYSGTNIKAMDIKHLSTISSTTKTLKIKKEYLAIQKNMPLAGWDVMILAPLSNIKQNRIITMIVLFLSITLSLLIGIIAWQRYKRQQEKEVFQHEAQKQLEHQVSVRTTDLRHEIEQRKQTENTLIDTQDELIQTAKLAVLGQMSASISHELNNPLAAIQSYAENARQFLGLNKLKQVDDNLGRIAQLTERMSKISSQLKFFSRKSSKKMEVVSITTVVQSAIDIISHQYKQSSSCISFQSQFSELKARADVIQLEQILINLINNAMQAIENLPQGKVIIHTEQQQEWVLIHVEDNGLGIELKNLDKIFDPFFTTKESGLGLGLSISARIIDIMNGRLSVRNLDDGGAGFTISLLVMEQDT